MLSDRRGNLKEGKLKWKKSAALVWTGYNIWLWRFKHINAWLCKHIGRLPLRAWSSCFVRINEGFSSTQNATEGKLARWCKKDTLLSVPSPWGFWWARKEGCKKARDEADEVTANPTWLISAVFPAVDLHLLTSATCVCFRKNLVNLTADLGFLQARWHKWLCSDKRGVWETPIPWLAERERQKWQLEEKKDFFFHFHNSC